MAELATIKEFTNVVRGGSYWLEGAEADKFGSTSVLTPRYNTFQTVTENDTGFSSLAGNVIQSLATFEYDSNRQNLLGIADDSIIYDFNESGLDSRQNGEIHSNSQTASNKNGIFPTKKDNILYSSSTHLGVAYFGTAESGSDSTTIVDEEGRDFSSLGLGTSSDNNKVYNLTKGEERTISSISTTNSTNDTLDLTSGNTTNDDGDKFIAFVDKKQDFFGGASYPHFKGQEDKADFIRQMEQLGLIYYIGNGNYLAGLDHDFDSSAGNWDSNAKQLPKKTQFRCMSSNNDSLLIGGEIRSRGKIMLWDGSIDGFNNVIDIKDVPVAMEPHKNGWLVIMGGGLYYTNGVDIQLQAEFPDLTGVDTSLGANYNSFTKNRDKVFALISPNSLNRLRDKDALAVFDLENGWSTRVLNHSSNSPYENHTVGAIKKSTSLIGASLFVCYDHDDGESTFGEVSKNNSGRINYSQIVDLDEPRDVNKLELSIAPRIDDFRDSDSTSTSVDINVAVGEMKDFLWQPAQSTSNSTKSQIEVNTSSQSRFSAKKGNKVMILQGPAAGDFTWIDSVDTSGSDEKWNVSPDLSTAPASGDDISVFDVKRAQGQTKTVDITDLNENLEFGIKGVHSDRIVIDVTIEGTGFMPDIHKIQIYD